MIDIIRSVGEFGAAGLAAVGLVFALGALVFMPRNLMCLASGFAFGVSAAPVVLVGATVGSGLAFLVSRHLFRDGFGRWAAKRQALRAVVQAVDEEGWRLIALLRLGAPVPSSALSYALGLTGVRLRHFSLATAIGLAPQTLLFVHLGAAGQTALHAAPSPAAMALSAAGLAAFGLAAWIVGKRAKAALRMQAAGAVQTI